MCLILCTCPVCLKILTNACLRIFGGEKKNSPQGWLGAFVASKSCILNSLVNISDTWQVLVSR